MFIKKLWRSYVINSYEWYFLGICLLINFIWNYSNNAISLNLRKGPCSFLVDGILFYLIVDAFREQNRLNRELQYVGLAYQMMKKAIVEKLIYTQYHGLPIEKAIQNIDDIYLDPVKAKKYFTQDVFLKVLENLDEDTSEGILREMQKFLNRLSNITMKFVEKGNYKLASYEHYFEWLESSMEQYLRKKRKNPNYIDFFWEEGFGAYSPLYRLICDDDAGMDPFLKLLNKQKIGC